MRITGDQINPVTTASRMPSASRDTVKADASTSSCRALIPISPVRYTERTQTVVRQPVNFLAHLIATQQAAPQTRERRRAEPNVAVAVYAAAIAPTASQFSHNLSRDM